MPLVTSRDMLLAAQRGGYAVGAFNVENMEMAQAVIEAAEAEGASIMLQTTPSTLKYASPAVFRGMVAALAGESGMPIALHLDHGNSVELAENAITAGYTSVMIDASQQAFEENISVTRKVVQAASIRDIPVEAELGLVGGKEDELSVDHSAGTDPGEAAEFASRTGIDSLAVAIGTAHGFYKGIPVLDMKRLHAIRQVVSIPLVLHGASGIPDQDVRACIQLGICKVNFATELRAAFTEGVRAYLADNPDAYDPKSFCKAGKTRVVALVREKIRCVGMK
ncbi:MAG: ketose-bisphosphate aldolase [Clostridia bacterium]|nr:ketose-bisphosphate aldolase [Clostridia bacterium]